MLSLGGAGRFSGSVPDRRAARGDTGIPRRSAGDDAGRRVHWTLSSRRDGAVERASLSTRQSLRCRRSACACAVGQARQHEQCGVCRHYYVSRNNVPRSSRRCQLSKRPRRGYGLPASAAAIFKWPSRRACCRGVLPAAFLMVASAPAASSARTVSVPPKSMVAAYISGV